MISNTGLLLTEISPQSWRLAAQIFSTECLFNTESNKFPSQSEGLQMILNFCDAEKHCLSNDTRFKLYHKTHICDIASSTFQISPLQIIFKKWILANSLTVFLPFLWEIQDKVVAIGS